MKKQVMQTQYVKQGQEANYIDSQNGSSHKNEKKANISFTKRESMQIQVASLAVFHLIEQIQAGRALTEEQAQLLHQFRGFVKLIEDSFRLQEQPLKKDTLHLTPREREVIWAASIMGNTRKIAEMLGISAHTVERHIANIGAKLNTSGLHDMVITSWEQGVLLFE